MVGEEEREEVSDGGREEGRYRKRGRERQRKERGSYSDLLVGRAAQGSFIMPWGNYLTLPVRSHSFHLYSLELACTIDSIDK